MAAFGDGNVGGTPNISINESGALALNEYTGSGFYTVYAGMSPNFTEITPPGSFPYAVRINKSGAISGTFSPYLPSIFLLQGSTYTTIAYPGANATYGGYLNDANIVAGAHQDGMNAWHGFVKKMANTQASTPCIPRLRCRLTASATRDMLPGPIQTQRLCNTDFSITKANSITLALGRRQPGFKLSV
jgi:hypothetical protein